MKQFLAVFDGFKMSNSTLAYALQLAKAEEAHLVGVFLDDFIYRSYNVTALVTSKPDYEKALGQLDAADKKKRDAAAVQFEKAAQKAGISYSIHRDTSIALQELKRESMFADLLVINEYETFSRFKEKPPTRFVKELLTDVQCPVLVVPQAYKPVDKAVLLYDGGPSSLYAIKMFRYVLAGSLTIPVEVLAVNEQANNLRMPEQKLMRKFILHHFPQAQFTVHKGNAEEQIIGHLKNHKENELVVLGAYRRGEVSRWFKTSMADVLMRELDTPLFIAHNK
jgi:nucleotide-binding universal stress UspA family protein